jgi:hypothetical protein
MLLVCGDLIKRWLVLFSRRGAEGDTATGSPEGGTREEAAGLLGAGARGVDAAARPPGSSRVELRPRDLHTIC